MAGNMPYSLAGSPPTDSSSDTWLAMTIVHFITHPEVSIDAAVPVPDWSLSPVGSRRMQAAMRRPWFAGVRSVFCSAEKKAMDAAGIVANCLGLRPIIVEALGENDRSATGYLPKIEFEAVADEFFARPGDSIRGSRNVPRTRSAGS